jgi:NAD(P)-dependent dehydrogenase (short-subunit alcohol dehydrogenase family)
MARWTPAQLPELTGKVALITGANSGIGFEAARALAKRGAHVILGCRDSDRGQAALDRILHEKSDARVELLALDLADLARVRAAAVRVLDAHSRLDLLCNNAGLMAIPRTLTSDGYEMQFAVNHLGHFALTSLLLGALLASDAARIVTISSLAHRIGRIRLDDLDGERGYEKWQAYGQSKLANLLFAYELQRRLSARGARAISVACHPGYASTNLQQVGPRVEGSRVRAAFFKLGNAVLAQSAEKGAWPTLYAATADEVRGGDYIGPGGPGELAGAPEKVGSSAASRDLEQARALWNVSVERTGVDYALLDA